MKESVLLHAILQSRGSLLMIVIERERKSEKQQIQRAYLPTALEKEISRTEGRQAAVASDSLNPESFVKVLDKSVIDYTGIFISLITSQNNQSKFISNTPKIRQKPAGHSGMLMGEKL